MTRERFPSPRYLLRLLQLYGLGALVAGLAFLFMTGLIARPVGTLTFVAGFITGAGIVYLGVIGRGSKPSWLEQLIHPDRQSA